MVNADARTGDLAGRKPAPVIPVRFALKALSVMPMHLASVGHDEFTRTDSGELIELVDKKNAEVSSHVRIVGDREQSERQPAGHGRRAHG